MSNSDIVQLFESLSADVSHAADVEVPKQLRATLFPHQKGGLNWLVAREQFCSESSLPCGGVLADEVRSSQAANENQTECMTLSFSRYLL